MILKRGFREALVSDRPILPKTRSSIGNHIRLLPPTHFGYSCTRVCGLSLIWVGLVLTKKNGKLNQPLYGYMIYNGISCDTSQAWYDIWVCPVMEGSPQLRCMLLIKWCTIFKQINCIRLFSLFVFVFLLYCVTQNVLNVICHMYIWTLYIYTTYIYIYTSCTFLCTFAFMDLDNLQRSHCDATGTSMVSRTVGATLPKSPFVRLMKYDISNLFIQNHWLYTIISAKSGKKCVHWIP